MRLTLDVRVWIENGPSTYIECESAKPDNESAEDWMDSVEFYWNEGNMACDCNRGSLILGQHSTKCGETLVNAELTFYNRPENTPKQAGFRPVDIVRRIML